MVQDDVITDQNCRERADWEQGTRRRRPAFS